MEGSPWRYGIGCKDGNFTLTQEDVIPQMRFRTLRHHYQNGGIVQAPVFIHGIERVRLLAGDRETDMVAVGTGPRDKGGVRVNHIFPGFRQQGGVKGQLPFGDVTVVATPSVDDRDGPSAVQRTSDELGERFVGMINLTHIDRIGGIDDAVVHVDRLIDVSQSSGITVPVGRVGIVRPRT